MDRREALRRIGAGAVVTAAGSTIVSSRAFAYDLPFSPVAPPLFVQNTPPPPTNSRVFRVDIESTGSTPFGTASCNASAISQTVEGTFVRWDISVNSITPSGQNVQLRPFNGGAVIADLPASHFDGRGFRLRKRQGSSDTEWDPGDSFDVDLVVEFSCRYSDNTVRTLQHIFSYTVTKGPDPPSDDNWAVAGP